MIQGVQKKRKATMLDSLRPYYVKEVDYVSTFETS